MAAQQAPRQDPIGEVFASFDYDPQGHQRLLAFLTKHPKTVEVLLDARPHLRRILNPKRMTLDAVIDPEDETAWEALYCIIEGDWEPKAALGLMRQFDEEWWLERMQANGLLDVLNFDLDFSGHAAP